MFKGCQGKVLFIDLSSGEIKKELLRESDYENYLGGYGLACKIIYERMKANVDPLGPENILAFTTGLLVGTPAISGLRFTVSAKSPLTRTWGDANCGGYFAPALKFSGYDAIFFTGCAQKPKYLFIDNGEVKLCDAEELWGKDTSETEDILKEQLGKDVRVACIGPGGEKLSLISCIMHDKGRAAGRSGLGAVMGSKKLKAVVVKGNIKVPLYDAEKAKELRKKWRKALMAKPSSQKFLKYGTISHVASSTFINDAPVKNWAGVGVRDFPQADLISDDNILKYEYKKYGCWQCPLACSGYYQVEEGPYTVKEAHKPEYETCGVLGPNLLNDNLESIIKMNDMFNLAAISPLPEYLYLSIKGKSRPSIPFPFS
ncbi:putative oxidoreductase YdhV [subsurface metagenome]